MKTPAQSLLIMMLLNAIVASMSVEVSLGNIPTTILMQKYRKKMNFQKSVNAKGNKDLMEGRI